MYIYIYIWLCIYLPEIPAELLQKWNKQSYGNSEVVHHHAGTGSALVTCQGHFTPRAIDRDWGTAWDYPIFVAPRSSYNTRKHKRLLTMIPCNRTPSEYDICVTYCPKRPSVYQQIYLYTVYIYIYVYVFSYIYILCAYTYRGFMAYRLQRLRVIFLANGSTNGAKRDSKESSKGKVFMFSIYTTIDYVDVSWTGGASKSSFISSDFPLSTIYIPFMIPHHPPSLMDLATNYHWFIIHY